jgi:hypothetical protein
MFTFAPVKNKGFIIGFSFILLIILGGVFYLMDQRFLNGKAVQTSKNYLSAVKAHPIIVKISISDDDMARMKMQREQALERGIMTNEGENYVSATIIYGKEKAKADIRLKGHMTDHLQDKKWSFRVKPDKKLNGMKRFTLQHPGTRNYLYEFFFHQIAKDLGIAALRYDFVKVYVNNEMWGIYAMEEHFTKEMLAANGRKNGPIIRFNPDLYWDGRLKELEGARLAEDQNTLYGSFPEAYGMGKISKDDSLLALYQEAYNKMNDFIQGKIETNKIFDIEKLADYHALIDLVGGHHSLDWSDVKYYYNPESRLLEPVAYESFSIRETKTLAGSFKYDQWDDKAPSFHALLFSDKVFFEAYMKSVKRLSKKEFMDGQLAKHKDRLERKYAILNLQYAYKSWNTAPYYGNQKRMKALANPKLHIRAYAHEKNGKLVLQLANLTNLPIEVKKIKYGKQKLKDNFVIAPKKRFSYPAPIEMETQLDFVKGEKCEIETSVLGMSKELETEALPIELRTFSNTVSINNHEISKNIYLDSIGKTAIIASGKLSESIHFTKDWTVKIFPRAKVSLAKNVCLKIDGRSYFRGNEEEPINIKCDSGARIINSYIAQWSYVNFEAPNDFEIDNTGTLKMLYSSGQGVHFTNREEMVFDHCFFEHNKIGISNYKGSLKMKNSILKSPNCFHNQMGSALFTNCTFFGDKAVAGYESYTRVQNCTNLKIEKLKNASVIWS